MGPKTGADRCGKNQFMSYATINPATGQTEKTFPAHTPAEVEALLQRAVDTFPSTAPPATPSGPAT